MVILEKIEKPSETTEPAQIAEPVQIAEPSEIAEPAKITKTAKNTKTAKITKTAEPVESSEPTKLEAPFEPVKLKRGRPKKVPAPKPEPKQHSSPNIVTVPPPTLAPQYGVDQYSQHLIDALVAHHNSSKAQRQSRWSSLVRF